MSSSAVLKSLGVVLADTYTLYLKTQNYHWHVKGKNFFSLHTMFQGQYEELLGAIDEIAERIVALGGLAPATFADFLKLKTIKEGEAAQSSEAMLSDLKLSHEMVLKSLTLAHDAAEKENDHGTVDLMIVRMEAHQKALWMVSASL